MSLQLNKLGDNHYIIDPNSTGDHGTTATGSIQSAINSLPTSGGVIQLVGGTYYADSGLNINKNNVMLLGSGKTVIILRNPLVLNGYRASVENIEISVASGGHTAQITVGSSSEDTIIRRCVISNYYTGILVNSNARKVRIIDNKFTGPSPSVYIGTKAISVGPADWICIKNNTFTNAGSTNVYLNQANKFILSDNHFYNTHVQGARLVDIVDGGVSIISNNNFIRELNDQSYSLVRISSTVVLVVTSNNFFGGSKYGFVGIEFSGVGAVHYAGNQFHAIKECSFPGFNNWQVGNCTELYGAVQGVYSPDPPYWSRQYSN